MSGDTQPTNETPEVTNEQPETFDPQEDSGIELKEEATNPTQVEGLDAGLYDDTGRLSVQAVKQLIEDKDKLNVYSQEIDMSKFWAMGFSEHTMLEDRVSRFEGLENISYNHLIATLQEKITWRNREVILTGIAPKEVTPPARHSVA